jgi:hypothetical protein
MVRQHHPVAVDDQPRMQQPLAVVGDVAERLLGAEGPLVEVHGRLAADHGNIGGDAGRRSPGRVAFVGHGGSLRD